MKLRVLALDPGEKVGWANGTIDTEKTSLVVANWGIATMKDMALKLLDRATYYDVIAYEEYVISGGRDLRAHVGTTVPTLQFVGMVRLAVWSAQAEASIVGHPGPQLAPQRNTAKATGRAAVRAHAPHLEEVVAEALEGRHDEGHHGDAIMHLLYYFHKHYV